MHAASSFFSYRREHHKEKMAVMEITVAIIISCLSAIVSSIAGCIIYYAWHTMVANRKEASSIKAGLPAVLRNRLIRLMLEAEEHKFASVRDVENVALMIKAYEGLGGNGMVEGLYENFRKLPHIKPGGKEVQNETVDRYDHRSGASIHAYLDNTTSCPRGGGRL